MVIAGGSDPEYLNGQSTLSHVEMLTSGSSAACHFDIQHAMGEKLAEEFNFESSAHVEGGSGKIFWTSFKTRSSLQYCILSQKDRKKIEWGLFRSAAFILKTSLFSRREKFLSALS